MALFTTTDGMFEMTAISMDPSIVLFGSTVTLTFKIKKLSSTSITYYRPYIYIDYKTIVTEDMVAVDPDVDIQSFRTARIVFYKYNSGSWAQGAEKTFTMTLDLQEDYPLEIEVVDHGVIDVRAPDLSAQYLQISDITGYGVDFTIDWGNSSISTTSTFGPDISNGFSQYIVIRSPWDISAEMSLKRCVVNETMDDPGSEESQTTLSEAIISEEGERLMLTASINCRDYADSSIMTCKLYYASGQIPTTASSYIDLTSSIDVLRSGVVDDYSLVAQEFSNGIDWHFMLVVGDSLEEAEAHASIPRAFANFHLSGGAQGGAAFGRFSSADDTHPKLECEYPAYFNGGIEDVFVDWQLVQLNSGTTTPGVYGPCELRIGKIGSHVFMRGSVKTKHGNTICIVPEEFRPKDIDNIGSGNCGYFWFAPTTGSNITRLNLNTTTGVLKVEWVKKISDASNVTSALTWVQVNIDWWLD